MNSGTTRKGAIMPTYTAYNTYLLQLTNSNGLAQSAVQVQIPNLMQVSGCQWSPVVASGRQWSLVVTSGHQWSPVVASGHQWSLVVKSTQIA